MQMSGLKYLNNKISTFFLRAGETEWAHALAGGLSVREAEGSVAR